ncbi:MAG: phosphodiester glycosidase family protein, partial [Armatimonadetes bacterium]|nr:phosphodiester glycosidase family protein [Armatimonadota bacterium]
EDGWTQVVVPCRNHRQVDIFALTDPARLVIDVTPPTSEPGEKGEEASAAQATGKSGPRQTVTPEQATAKSTAPSLWRTMTWPTAAGQALVHLVLVKPSPQTVLIRPALGGPLVRSLCSVSYIARVHHALAAINGGFFSPTHKVPLGMLVIDGEWMRAPLPHRPVLAIMRDGHCEIARVQFDARVHFEGLGYLPVLGLNQNHWEDNSIVVYTYRWGSQVGPAVNTTRLVVSARGRVVYRSTDGKPVPLPAGGMVISGCGKRAESLKKVPLGCQVKLKVATKPQWPDMVHALGGGPLLVAAGKAVLNPSYEGFRSDVASGRRPRTAVGILKDGRVVLVAAEGRPLGRGPGLSLWELTKLMLKLGAQSAMNLDGGSSTTLVVKGRTVTHCSAGAPRPVNNALVVVPASQQH